MRILLILTCTCRVSLDMLVKYTERRVASDKSPTPISYERGEVDRWILDRLYNVKLEFRVQKQEKLLAS